jgi:hypothetical protein
MSYTEAFDLVSAFYRKHGDGAPQTASEGFRSGRLMGCLVDFPKNVLAVRLYYFVATNAIMPYYRLSLH